jgi:aminoglycoside phosphotransferase (APT) family kinase protein
MVPGVQSEGCSTDRAQDAVRNLAALHAPRWNDSSLFDLDFLRRTSEEGAAFLEAVAIAASEEFVARYRQDLDAADVATLGASAAVTAKWQLARAEPFAVVHGDYRLDNLLFAPTGTGIAAVDWQTVAVAPPTRDLAYFLGTSLRTEDRRDTEADLVGTYHDELIARRVTGYRAEACFDDYRLGQLQGPLITTLGCIYAPNARTERSDAMFLTMARRSCAAIRELGTLDLL